MSLWKTHPGYFESLQGNMTDQTFLGDSNLGIELGPEAEAFLGKLSLLGGIPFHYLVPDEKMLPPESIRFFCVDPNWIASLQDGALGIGRGDAHDLAHDQAAYATVHQASLCAAHAVRNNAMPSESSSGLVSGLLLRSSVVGGWPGLKLEGYATPDDGKNRVSVLPILRMERLAANVLLCLFSGRLGYLEVHEPAEAIHFGVDLPDNPDDPKARLRKGLRAVVAKDGKQPGDALANVSVEVPLRNNGRQVLQIQKLAQCMQPLVGGTEFTSAEFALEMVEGVQKVAFTIGGTSAHD